MQSAPLSREMRRAAKGSALVIVLFFVILLTVVTIAFLSRSLTAVKVSSSSTGETKANLLASSASDIIIGDLKQEIVAGSTSSGASVAWPVYVPNANVTAIPYQNGVPLLGSPATNAIPNMISRSVSTNNISGTAPYVAYSTTYYTNAPPARAASDPSAASPTLSYIYPYTTSKVNSSYPSINGRYVSPAQWNSHYLIPRNTSVDAAGSTSTDSTPVANFVTPDWVIVTRGGATSVTSTSPGFSTGGLNDSTLTNTNYALGRYAYAVYNEGGLLDMNVAGYPGTDSGSSSVGLTSTQISEKGSLALADLTQLTTGTTSLTQAQINNIVGWRNYSTAELSGTYGSFAFSSTTSGNWLTNFATGNTNGFMQITPPPSGVTTPPTDQAFLSRQQLISVLKSLSISPDFLQYMGTFSRALQQPSTVPDPNRPRILTTATGQAGSPGPPASNQVDSYTGNNDQEGNDATSATHPINPSFLSVRVKTAFTRQNGTTAIIGEPLVKTKFPLSWLSAVTYSAVNYSSAALAATHSDPIYARFGIYRSSASSPWVYNHGQSYIMTLDQVAALAGSAGTTTAPREPDFAELLKAAIIAGSLGKGGPNIHNSQNNYQYTLDAQVDFQIIQIMANLIDQQDTDSYPTCIQINNGTQGMVTAYGVEDLPYFYRFHLFSVVKRLPAPLLSKTTSVTFPAAAITGTTSMATTYPTGGTTTKTWNITTSAASTYTGCQNITTAGTLSDQGEAVLLYIPDLWNPHDPNTVSTSSSRPAAFRICAATCDPVGLLTPWTVGAESELGGPNTSGVFLENSGGAIPSYYYWPISGGGLTAATPAPTTWPLTTSSVSPSANTAITFTDGGGTMFREPTLLWNQNIPSISGPNVKDINTGQTYYGFNLGHTPISTQATITSVPAQTTDGTYIFQGGNLAHTELLPSGNSYDQITILLQYQDPTNSSNWITYDVKYPEVQHTMSNPNLIVNTADFSGWQCPVINGQLSGAATVMDPRSARWGVGTAATLGNAGENSTGQLANSNVPYVLEPTASTDMSGANYAGMKSLYFNELESNRPRVDAGNVTYYSNPCMTSDPGPGTTPTFGAATTTSGFRNLQMRWVSPGEYRLGSGYPKSPADFDGLFSQNNPAIKSATLSQNGALATEQIFNEDADAVARPAMGAYADTTLAGSTIGLPLATASTFPSNNGVASATSQSQSRPIILNRPFRSVSEMSYAFRGSPWKNIDFFNPASGDSALLDTFCLTPPPSNAIVAGKVDLNTRQIPVLQAIVAGAYRDEINNAAATPPNYALAPLTGISSGVNNEANAIAQTLEKITSDTTDSWRGPLKNISGLVGRYVATPATTPTDTDIYTYQPQNLTSSSSGGAPGTTALPAVSYAGLSSALDCTYFFGVANHVFQYAPTAAAQTSSPLIQRFREAAIRPLVDSGQVRVWNLLIDIVAQTGHYPKTAASLDQFYVDGQKHLWVHVAIDRYTGQVIDKQVEVVTP